MSTNPYCIDTRGGSLPFDVPSWTDWMRSVVRIVVRDLGRIIDVVLVWEERSRQRRALYGLDDRALTDMGLSRADVEQESRKPFWIA